MRLHHAAPALVTIVAAMAAQACQTRLDLPVVQPSNGESAHVVVTITPEGTYESPCVTIVAGRTVEWRNAAPEYPADVTSLGDPVELYSPTLTAPYNLVDEGGERYSYWRHTFEEPGVYEYYDTSQGDPGRKVVDPYYGTVTFVGIGDDLRTGVVCVEPFAGAGRCAGVCCIRNGECPSVQCCDLDGFRCVQAGPQAPLCAAKPAFREFECFLDSECADEATCSAESHICQGE